MLESIHVKNVALIDEAEVEFHKGLNILTGETGAGKSILLGSVQLALGAKADKGLIGQGAEYASVQLVFSLEERQREILSELDIPLEEEELLILQRRIYPNKSICKINGETVTLKTMQSAAELLIDIHGQREHQSILKASKQEEILDDYCKERLSGMLAELSGLYKEYLEEEAGLKETAGMDKSFLKDLELARYELDEIEKAELKEGEDEALEERYVRLSNAKKIRESVGAVGNILQNENGSGILNGISFALRQLKEAWALDDSLKEEWQQLSDAETVLQECSYSLDRYLDRFSMEEGDLAAVEERLNMINHLKDKFGKEISHILEYEKDLNLKINKLENFEQYNEELKKKHEKTKEAYFALAAKLHEIRNEEAEKLAGEMENALYDLNFEQCSFYIKTEYDEKTMSKKGCSRVTFQISLNPGEPLKDLSSVASGGELSRIMLALKSVFAHKDKTGTLVFDEIDAGISGKTAWKVSEKLAVLRNRHQVLCITHLPQIAAMADAHFCIEKSVEDSKARTRIRLLDKSEGIREIGRLLGTDQLTNAVLKNAAEMKDLAEQTKQSQSKIEL